MKAIVVFFDGNVTEQKEAAMVTSIAQGVYSHSTTSMENISIHVLNDAEVNNALIKAISTPASKPTATEMTALREYCEIVINKVGSPALMTKPVFRNEFLSSIQKYPELRNIKMLQKIEKNGMAVSTILKKYGLEQLTGYIPDVKALFRVFNYGEI